MMHGVENVVPKATLERPGEPFWMFVCRLSGKRCVAPHTAT